MGRLEKYNFCKDAFPPKKRGKNDFDRLTDQRQDSFFLPYMQQNDYNYIHHLVRAKSSRLLFLN